MTDDTMTARDRWLEKLLPRERLEEAKLAALLDRADLSDSDVRSRYCRRFRLEEGALDGEVPSGPKLSDRLAELLGD